MYTSCGNVYVACVFQALCLRRSSGGDTSPSRRRAKWCRTSRLRCTSCTRRVSRLYSPTPVPRFSRPSQSLVPCCCEYCHRSSWPTLFPASRFLSLWCDAGRCVTATFVSPCPVSPPVSPSAPSLSAGIAHRDLKPENILCTRPGHVSAPLIVSVVTVSACGSVATVLIVAEWLRAFFSKF